MYIEEKPLGFYVCMNTPWPQCTESLKRHIIVELYWELVDLNGVCEADVFVLVN